MNAPTKAQMPYILSPREWIKKGIMKNETIMLDAKSTTLKKEPEMSLFVMLWISMDQKK